jgi:hypothetical protein
MSSEAEVQKEMQKNFSWQGTISDLTSFNTYGVVTLSNGKQANVQITLRHGLAPEKAYDDFKNFVKLLDLMAQDHEVVFWDGVRKYDNGSKPAAESGGTNGATPSNGSNGDKPKRNYKDPVPQAELPAELAEVTVDIWAAEFDALEILPKPDEKSSINFIKDGLQYPVGSINKWRYATIKEFLASLTEDEINPAVAKVHRIAGVLYWKQGNAYTDKNGAQKHYKDVVLAKPAF